MDMPLARVTLAGGGYVQTMTSRGPLQSVPDEELISRAARSDPGALAELYDRHSPTALALARRILGPHRAEDAVQEAFTSIWRSASTYESERGLVRTWLLRVVRHRSIDILRAAAADGHRVDQAGREQEHSAGPETPEAAALRRDGEADVHDALRSLPDEQRAVVELAYFRGLSQAEIAEELSLPVGTVKSRARLALVKLRGALEPADQLAE